MTNQQNNELGTFFQEYIAEKLNLNEKLKSPNQQDRAMEDFAKIIADAAKTSTRYTVKLKETAIPVEIGQLVKLRQQHRCKWFRACLPQDKTTFNKLAKKVGSVPAHYKNETFQQYLQLLSPSKNHDYSLWKDTKKKIHRPIIRNTPLKAGTDEWVRDEHSRVKVFAQYLETIFQSNKIVSDIKPVGSASETDQT